MKGPGYTNTNAHGFNITNAFYVTIENIYASDVRDVFHLVEGEYIIVKNVHAEPISEWSTGEHWRGIYCTEDGDNGPMVYFEECFFFHSRDSGVWIEELEIGRFHRVIVAEPGYGDDAGSHGYGFCVRKANSYCTFSACEADTTHGNSWNIENLTGLEHSYIDIDNCFASAYDGYNAHALYIAYVWGVKITGGEWRAVDAEVIYLNNSDYSKLMGCEVRGHNKVTDPGVYYDGVTLVDCDGTSLIGLHIQTPYSASGKIAINETDGSYCTIDSCTFWSAGTVYWATHIHANESLVSNCPRVNYQIDTGSWTAPTDVLGNGSTITLYNGDQSPDTRLYVRTNYSWQYEELT